MSFQETKSSEKLNLSEIEKAYFLDSVRWTKLLSILGFISVISTLVSVLDLLFTRALFAWLILGQMGVLWLGVVLLSELELIAYPISLLFLFSIKSKGGVVKNDPQMLGGDTKPRIMYIGF